MSRSLRVRAVSWRPSGSGSLPRATVLAAAALAVTSVGATAAAAVPAHRAATTSTVDAVPWRQAGPGWAVAAYSASRTTLYLTTPRGGKYAFHTWPASSGFNLLDWSGDRQRVLVEAFDAATGGLRMEQVSLGTGKVISRFTLPAHVFPIGYTRPDGLNLLAARQLVGRAAWQIVRYNLAGRLQQVVAKGRILGSAIDSPDGASVIVGTGVGLEVVRNTGGLIRRLRAPVAVFGCVPVRWWNARTVLAYCYVPSFGPRLMLFPVTGAKATVLTPPHRIMGFLGDVAAWKLRTRLYVQLIVGVYCQMAVGQQFRDGSVHVIHVPGANDRMNHIVTGLGTRLLVTSAGRVCGGYSLLWFDPFTKTVKYILHAPANILGVEGVVPYGRPLTS